MRVLLVQPNYRVARESWAWRCNPPLGLAYIAAVLEKNNIEVKIIDANVLDLTPEQVVAEAKDFDIVGISFLTPAHIFGAKVVNLLPKSVLKVAGGPHATGYAEDMLNAGFDIVVRGEGEYTMFDIAQRKPLKDIQGMSYKEDNKIKHNPDRPPLDPNDLPYPARHLLLSNGVDIPYLSAGTKNTPWAPIMTSRGCPYNCYYCCKKIFGHKFRPRSPESVVDEMAFLKKEYGVKEIHFYDDCFNFDMDRADKILDLMIERKLNIKFRCSNGIRADKVNENLLRKMKKAGCIYIAYGVESGNQAVLDKIPKAETLEQIREAIRLTKKVGIFVCGFFIFGLLGDTKETMQQTLDFAKSLDVDLASFSITTPYPGTRIWEEVQKNGKMLIKSWEDFHHTSARMMFTHPDVASPQEVEEAYQKAYNEFYLRPTYLIKKFFNIRSFSEMRLMLRWAKALLRTHKRGKMK